MATRAIISISTAACRDGDCKNELEEAYRAAERVSESEAFNARTARLIKAVKELYSGTVGNGSTADAVRQEAISGRPVWGRFHYQDAMGWVRYLRKFVKSQSNFLLYGGGGRPPPTGSAAVDLRHDLALAERIIADLQQAIKLWRLKGR